MFDSVVIGTLKGLGDYAVHAELRRALDDLDTLTLELVLGEGADRSGVLKACVAGATWEMKVGKATVKGDVVRSTFRVGAGRTTVVSVTGLETLHRLASVPVCATYETAVNDVATTLAKLGQVRISATKVAAPAAPTVVAGGSAFAALSAFARARNFAVWMDGDTVVFAPRGTAKKPVTVTLRLGTDVQDLEYTTDLTAMPTGVRLYARDYLKDALADYKATPTDLRKISGGDDGPTRRKKGFGEALWEEVIPAGDGVASAVKERAVGQLQAAAERFVTGVAVCPKFVDLSPGHTLKLENAQWPLTGPVLVSAVAWRSSSRKGVETRIEFFSDSLPKAA